jgi:hypothetical protein
MTRPEQQIFIMMTNHGPPCRWLPAMGRCKSSPIQWSRRKDSTASISGDRNLNIVLLVFGFRLPAENQFMNL